MKNCLVKINKEINGKKVKLELGADTHKDPTKRFRLCWWYIEAYVYVDDEHYQATKNICDRFSDVTDIIKRFDIGCELDGGLWEAVEKALSIANTVLYKKVFNAVVYSQYADVIDLMCFGYGIDWRVFDFIAYEESERKAVLEIHNKILRDFERKYVASFKDGVLRIVGHDDNDSPFCDWDYVHLFQLMYFDFSWYKDECEYELKHPTPIFSEGENLIGIEFKAEAVED